MEAGLGSSWEGTLIGIEVGIHSIVGVALITEATDSVICSIQGY